MDASNEPLRISSPNPKVESRGYQSMKGMISLDQKPDFKSPRQPIAQNWKQPLRRDETRNKSTASSKRSSRLWDGTETLTHRLKRRNPRYSHSFLTCTAKRISMASDEGTGSRVHMLNIRQHKLRLLDFSRGSKQPVGDELHQTLDGYRHSPFLHISRADTHTPNFSRPNSAVPVVHFN